MTATATINAASDPCLSINKALAPASVPQNGQLTYTFLIENYGNRAAEATDAGGRHGRVQPHSSGYFRFL